MAGLGHWARHNLDSLRTLLLVRPAGSAGRHHSQTVGRARARVASRVQRVSRRMQRPCRLRPAANRTARRRDARRAGRTTASCPVRYDPASATDPARTAVCSNTVACVFVASSHPACADGVDELRRRGGDCNRGSSTRTPGRRCSCFRDHRAARSARSLVSCRRPPFPSCRAPPSCQLDERTDPDTEAGRPAAYRGSPPPQPRDHQADTHGVNPAPASPPGSSGRPGNAGPTSGTRRRRHD
jgi:hypothetical protein